MSEPIASSSTLEPPREDTYPQLLASLRQRFARATAGDGVRLFATRTPALFDAFLDGLPPELRQEHVCHACRRFVERYGGLVTITPEGATVPVMWDPETAPQPYVAAIRALASAVSRAPIAGVFLTEEATWGQPETGEWQHFAVTPAAALLHRPSPIKTTSQTVAERSEDYALLCRGLDEFPLDVVSSAWAWLTTEQLHRSEVCVGVAKWLVGVHERRAAVKDTRARDNVTWLAVASAPPGFCHVRSTMIGTLLEDLVARLPFSVIKERFDAKMHPLQYMRPTAEPGAGNIAQAEKIVEKLRSAGALERRFARLDDIQTLWRPAGPPPPAEKKGVFGHLKAQKDRSGKQVEVPPIVMTWDKFSRTVLPTAESVEFLVPTGDQSYMAMVTAANPEAPPIVQWDAEDRRNPVTWYFYVNGSSPARWNLKPGVYHPVTAVALMPNMWDASRSFAHHGEKAVFILQGAKDKDYVKGAGFFPSFLKSEYHSIRATMEAYASSAVVAGKDEAEVCGIGLQKGVGWNFTFRVTAKGGVQATYRLDRWD